jgi:hypothetical protein
MVLMDQRRARGETDREDELDFLISLMQHADELLDETNYTASTNHGMMQNSALLSIAAAYPELDNNGLMRQAAISRTLRYIRENVSKEGVLLELTPCYHWFVTEQILWFVATCDAHSISLTSEIETTAKKMLAFCRELLHPDRTLPQIADCSGSVRSLANWPLDQLPEWPEVDELNNAVTNKDRLPNEPIARLWPESGYFILRTGAPTWTPADALVLVFKTGSRSRAHSHFDALSVTIYANGQPVLSGPGYPDYEPSTNRLELIGTQNQNTVCVDDHSQQLVDATVNFCDVRWPSDKDLGPQFVAIQAVAETYPGVQHRRTLFYGPTRTAILIFDELTSNDIHKIRQNFRMAPGSYPKSRGRAAEVIASFNDRVLATIGTKIYRHDRVEEAHPVVSQRTISFPTEGQHVTYFTTIETDSTSRLSSISNFEGAIRWIGPEGILSVQLPIEESYQWSSTTVP